MVEIRGDPSRLEFRRGSAGALTKGEDCDKQFMTDATIGIMRYAGRIRTDMSILCSEAAAHATETGVSSRQQAGVSRKSRPNAASSLYNSIVSRGL